MATKNNPGKYDCYENAEPDEPMFVLLGRDRTAPETLATWIRLREAEGRTSSEKLAEARACLEAMRVYRRQSLRAQLLRCLDEVCDAGMWSEVAGLLASIASSPRRP